MRHVDFEQWPSLRISNVDDEEEEEEKTKSTKRKEKDKECLRKLSKRIG